MASRLKNSTKVTQPKCLKNGKKPCKKCERCIELAEMAKIVSKYGTAERCSSPHIPQFLIDAKKNKHYKNFYSDDKGIIEKILDGPHKHFCQKCSNDFGFFKVKWFSCTLDMGFGPGISWIGDDCLEGTEDLEEFFEEKNNEFQKELHEEFVMTESLIDEDVNNNNDDDDDDNNLDNLGLGTEASSTQPKRRTKRAGKKIQQIRQRSAAASETSSCNTSQFKRESEHYWNRLKQLRHHRKNKKTLPGISNDLVKFFTDKYQDFSSARKQRGKNLPEALASVEQIQKYEEIACHNTLHSVSVKGITALDMQNNFIASGGMDKTIVLFDLATGTIKNTYKGHQKHITAVRLHPKLQTIVSGSFDSQIRIWNTDEQNARKVIGIHQRPITDVSLHPTGDFALCCSEDSHWSLTDFNSGRPVVKVIDTGSQGICCGQFHPDGHIFGTGGENSIVKIWNICDQSSATQFLGHKDVVAALSFSENGYYLASGSVDGEVKIWDLRTYNNLSTFSPYEAKQTINCLNFDQSGAYLAVGGSNVQVYQAKTWNNIAKFNTHTQAVTGVCFSEDSKTIVSSSFDNNVHIYGSNQ